MEYVESIFSLMITFLGIGLPFQTSGMDQERLSRQDSYNLGIQSYHDKQHRTAIAHFQDAAGNDSSKTACSIPDAFYMHGLILHLHGKSDNERM